MALIFRNSGSQSPDRWLKETRNNQEEVLQFFEKIDQYLNDNGIIYISGKNGLSTGKVEDGRFFLEFTEQLVEKILTVNKQLKQEQLWYTEDVSGRRGFRWLNVVLSVS